MRPESMARLVAKTGPPMSRTDVKPSIKKRSIIRTELMARSGSSMSVSTVPKWALMATCACPSIKPGMSVARRHRSRLRRCRL